MLIMKGMAKSVTARVIYDGNTVFEAELSQIKEKKIIAPVNGVEITAENGAIGFTSSDCPSHECVKGGMLSRPYQTAACIPNKVLIILTPNGKLSRFDAITY